MLLFLLRNFNAPHSSCEDGNSGEGPFERILDHLYNGLKVDNEVFLKNLF